MIHLKSRREIAKMRESADLVSRTLAEVGRSIRPGVTTAELDVVAEDFLRSHDAVPAFKGYKVGPMTFPSTLCVSVNDEVVHGIPGEYRLEEGDLLSVDCGALLNGYYGDSAYTFAVGAIAEEDAVLCRVTYDALQGAIEKAVAGNRIGDISHTVQSYCETRGYGVVKELVGHGIGKKLHEDPQIPNYGQAGSGRRLKKGLAVCLEPMINRGTGDVVTDDDGWTVRTADGANSAHYEHMVVVQEGEPEVLTTFAYIEDIVDAPYNRVEALTDG